MREFTQSEQETLEFLGRFGPTVNPLLCEIKGWTMDSDGEVCKTYLSSPALRDIANDLNSIAQWLDERANEADQRTDKV
jgi:hypothetical protein